VASLQKRRRSQQLDLGGHDAKCCRLEHRHEPRERVCGFCVGRGESVAVGSAVACGSTAEPPEDELLDPAAGCCVASAAAGVTSAGCGVVTRGVGEISADCCFATGAAVGGMSTCGVATAAVGEMGATEVCAPVAAEPAWSFMARADQTISSKPTLPPARYMRASA
jgi:hypothetical protein